MSSNIKKTRINQAITGQSVRVIDHEGEQLGVISLHEALSKAQAVGLDLVEVSPNATPPVCRIMDYGKYIFEHSKRHKKKTVRVQVKELKLRPGTDIGDYNTKLRRSKAFIEKGNKVKFTIRFRGREMMHHNLGADLLERISQDVADFAVVEQQPKFEGRQMTMIIAPLKAGQKKTKETQTRKEDSAKVKD